LSDQAPILKFGAQPARGLKVAVVVARYNLPITTRLLKSCQARLIALGLRPKSLRVEWVPGAFELPLAAQAFAKSGKVDAVVALGAVLRGETSHYDLVCQSAASGLLQAGLDSAVPVAFGLVTCENARQALARSNGGPKDSGRHAAETAVWMARLLPRIS
jgi:6,7-dimethyl-8-ribityllumazine synthase